MAFGIDDAIAAGLKIADKFIPDPAAKAKFESELRADLLKWDGSQMAVNQAEAGSSDLFVAGWRPAVGWLCAAAIGWQYVLVPLGLWGAYATGHAVPAPPPIDEHLWELLVGMLGLGGLRTLEKLRGVAK
jgi:hypothetical protein